MCRAGRRLSGRWPGWFEVPSMRRLGTTAALVPFGPPQSARPFIIRMNAEQRRRLARLGYEKGDHAELCKRIYLKSQEKDGQIYAIVLATDMAVIMASLKSNESGSWRDLFREMLGTASGL